MGNDDNIVVKLTDQPCCFMSIHAKHLNVHQNKVNIRIIPAGFNCFKAIFDFENVEIGWINFNTGGAPDFRMARYSDGGSIDKPGDDFKRGVRFVVKLSKESGGDVREFASNAGAFLDGAKKLHDEYEAGAKENAGKLPVIALKDSVAKTSGEGARKSTNYVPVFEIVSWVKRPDDLVYKARSSSSSASSPPSTGSTKVSAPGGEDDFG